MSTDPASFATSESLSGLTGLGADILSLVLQRLPIAVLVTDTNGDIKSFNTAAESLLGYAAPNAQLFQHFDINPDQRSQATVLIEKALHGELITNVEVGYSSPALPERQRYIGFTASSLLDNDNEIVGAVVVLQDVTEQHQADQLKDDFISIAAHELKNPMTSVKGYAQMLQRRLEKASGQDIEKNYVGRIVKQMGAMEGIINEFLDVSRIRSGKFELNIGLFDMGEVLRDAVERAQLGSTSHTIRLEGLNGGEIEGDRDRIIQVVNNLLGNAVRYSPEGGEIVVGLTNENNGLTIMVKDSGIGIAATDQTHIFERFYRGSGATVSASGLGLGLFISQAIIRQHKGQIWVHSDGLGNGSSFFFWLPFSQSEETPAAPGDLLNYSSLDTSNDLAGSQEGPEILLVDDDRDILALLTASINEAGWQVRTARTGLEAIQRIGEKKPDAVLLDMMMPVLDGRETVLQLRAQYGSENLPPLFLMSADPSLPRQAADLRVAGFIHKPFDLADVLKLLGSKLVVSS